MDGRKGCRKEGWEEGREEGWDEGWEEARKEERMGEKKEGWIGGRKEGRQAAAERSFFTHTHMVNTADRHHKHIMFNYSSDRLVSFYNLNNTH